MQQMVRMTAGILVMTALMGSAEKWLQGTSAIPAWTQEAAAAGETSYHRIALTALANQAAEYCERFSGRAGYTVQASVVLRADGALEEAELTVLQAHAPLMTAKELTQRLAEKLSVSAEKIQLILAEGQ